MKKQLRILIIAAIALALGFIVVIIMLMVDNSRSARKAEDAAAMQEQLDSLRIANEQLALSNEFTQIQAEFNQFEDQSVYLKNDSLVQQYNAAINRVNSLMADLNKERRSNKANRERITQLEQEIEALRGIVRHYLEEIQRLGAENKVLQQEIDAAKQQNQQLTEQVTRTNASNKQLTQTVERARKLNITGLSLRAYNKKGKNEKNVTKARQLGVSFTVSPNNTAAPGRKEFYVRITSPEGSVLGGAGTFPMDGVSLAYTARRSADYDNGELPMTIYWDVNTTLTPGDYTVEVFCDGYRLATRHVTLKK